MAQVGIARGVNEGASRDPLEARLRGHDERLHPAIVDGDVLDERVEQDAGARLQHEPLPHDLQVVRVVGDARSCPERIRPFDDRPEVAQCADDIVGDAADHLPGCRARRVETVERVEDGRAHATEKRELLDRSVSAPPRAAAIAAVEPAEPEPTTTTSNTRSP